MKINPTIFREYDIRGVAGESFTSQAIAEYERWYGPFPGITITLEAAEYIGKAYGTYIRREKGKRVIVGREIRPFAKELTESFVKGVLSTGCDVYDAGEVLTPLVYFAVAFFGFDGGVNVTGSHNVYFYNGFKMMSKNVRPIFGDKLQQLRKMIEAEDFEKGDGKYATQEVYADYEKYVLSHVKLGKPLKIVMDCGNGSSGPFAPRLFERLGCTVIGMYTEPDATFPHHIPDPEMPNTMVDLSKKVLAEHADLGVAFDADGDRVGFVDEKGLFLDADKFILVLARDILARHPGKKILYDVKCSRLLEELIPSYGGVPLMHKTGHGPIKDTLHVDPDIILAGEVSGHLYFVEDWFRFDDGLYGAAQLLKLDATAGRPFSALFEGIPQTVRTPELKLPCADEVKFEVVAKISDFFSSRYKTITIDGVRILFDQKSWGLIRASNTAGYLTIRAEADTEERLLEIKNILADKLEEFPEITDRLNRHEVASFTGRLGWV